MYPNPVNSEVRVLNALDGQSISAIMPSGVAASRGNFVRVDAATVAGQPSIFTTSTQFQLCTGAFGAMLERDVLNLPAIPLDQFVFGNQILTPTLAGQPVSARFVSEIEIEGPDLVETVAAGKAITVAPAIDLGLTLYNGKFALIDSGQLVVARVRGILTPTYPGNIRMYLVMEKSR